jgi:RNA polymerase sigma-70 factor (ECF subfamily)
LIDHFRKTSQRASVPLDVLEDRDDGNDPTLVVEGNLLTEQLMRALSHLDHNQREVVTLRFLMGLSLQEVAQAMDKSEAAVKSLQHRGLTMLRRALHPVEEQVA